MFTFLQTPAFPRSLEFGYKGAALGASEKEFKNKNKAASCFTNPSDKARECIIRDTTYMNTDVTEVHAIFALDRLGSVKIAFKPTGHPYNPSISPEANGAINAIASIACGAEAYQLEKRFGPFHKKYETKLNAGRGDLEMKTWYATNGTLTYTKRSNPLDENLNNICESEISMEMKDFYKLREKSQYGKNAIDDM